MADILLSEDEFERLKAVVTEAQALRDYLDGVRRTALRITPYHIEMPALRGALAAVSDIDMDNVRTVEKQSGVLSDKGHPYVVVPIEQLTWNDNMNSADTKPIIHESAFYDSDITPAHTTYDPILTPNGKIVDRSNLKAEPNARNVKRRRTSTAKK
jgi:hypothetical protein